MNLDEKIKQSFITLEAPTGHPPHVWTEEEEAELNYVIKHMIACEEAHANNLPLPEWVPWEEFNKK